MSTATSAEAKAKAEIDAYIQQNGGKYSDWYAGIAKDPVKRLFTDHKVDRVNGAWVHYNCGTDAVARNVEKHFLEKGCEGGPGGGDGDTKYAYAYKITSSTCEDC